MDSKRRQALTSIKDLLADNGYDNVRIDDYTATEPGNISVAVTFRQFEFYIWFEPAIAMPYELHVCGDLYVETFCATPRQVLLKIMTFAA